MSDSSFTRNCQRLALLTMASYQQVLEKVKALAQETRNRLLRLEQQDDASAAHPPANSQREEPHDGPEA